MDNAGREWRIGITSKNSPDEPKMMKFLIDSPEGRLTDMTFLVHKLSTSLTSK